MFEIELGAKVKDKVTGSVGSITARVEYIWGEPSYLMEFKSKSGNHEEKWYPASRLEVLKDE